MNLNDRLRGKQKHYFILELCTEQELNKLASHYDPSLVMLPTDNLPQAHKEAMADIKRIREEESLDMYFNVGNHTAKHEQIKIEFLKNGKPVFSGVFDDPLQMIDSAHKGIQSAQSSLRYEKMMVALAKQPKPVSKGMKI
ncbi:hypothetical protein [Burkholderia cenocepacia]|uniref:hypothetical protein n=1 Tax=Burkholderia cenocepacia TaxID=95486 RepID=UPI0011157B1B|nr:hypothetical protein [Burkholderia cenocepacia]